LSATFSTDTRAAIGADRRPVLLIGGPTASGKSALALAIARAFDGVIINADSMQLYREIPILSGQPSAADRTLAPHRLYGVLAAAEVASAALWRTLAITAIAEAHGARRLPIVIGGTGLYLHALEHGLAPVPDVPADLRARLRDQLAEKGVAALHARLADRDPAMAAALQATDSQRILRALEVVEATGRSLAAWQAVEPAADENLSFQAIVLDPPRLAVYAACATRFQSMLAAGALDEVRALQSRGLDPALPAMKALGVAPLAAHLEGEIDLETAVERAVRTTRNYAKRQVTWFRHRMPEALRFEKQFSEREALIIFPFIRQFLLTTAG